MRDIRFRALTNCNVMVHGFYVYDEHLKLHHIDTGVQPTKPTKPTLSNIVP